MNKNTFTRAKDSRSAPKDPAFERTSAPGQPLAPGSRLHPCIRVLGSPQHQTSPWNPRFQVGYYRFILQTHPAPSHFLWSQTHPSHKPTLEIQVPTDTSRCQHWPDPGSSLADWSFRYHRDQVTAALGFPYTIRLKTPYYWVSPYEPRHRPTHLQTQALVQPTQVLQ